jgi:1-acyl-sn-glycerol-3-phosphate acyltransferase
VSAVPDVRAWRVLDHPVWAYRLVQILFGWLVRLLFLTSRHGLEKLPKKGPVILASNHASNIDPVLVVASMPRPIFHLGKHTLFRHWLPGLFLQTLGGQIPVDRETGGNQSALDAGLIVLERGLALGIYPEGTRSSNGKLQPGRTGVALFAFLTGAPVYPVALQGTYEAWPRQKRFPRLFRRTRLLVGEPIQVPKDPRAADDPRRCRQLTDDIMTALGRLVGQSYRRSRLAEKPAR